jgi:hypothetical protein
VSSLLKIQAGRVSNVAASAYVGDKDLLFYDETGVLRIGDGITPGGIPLNFSGAATSSTVFNNFLPGIDNTYNLGSPTNRWRTLHLSSSTFFVGGNTVTISNTGTLFINGNPVGGGTTVITTGTSTVIVGFTGSQGSIGYTGSAGISTSTNNLVWTSTGTRRLLTGYVDPGGISYTVRETQLINGSFILNLAGFTPTLTGSILPSNALNWDVPCTGFTVNVTNPTDFLDQWISSVRRLTQLSGTVTVTAASYTTTGPSVSPAAGISWSQIFNTNGTAVIRSTSSSLSGGTASANIHFNFRSSNSPTETEYIDSIVTATVAWATPSISISMSDLTGNNFLQNYTQTNYAISVTGISSSSNYTLAVTSVGGTPSNLIGNGSLLFSAPLHKNSAGNSVSVAVVATFTRPAAVTGIAYNAQASANDLALTMAFTYPSFWVWTDSSAQPPLRTNIVTGSTFAAGVTILGNQVKNFASFVNNTALVPRVFWLGVRSSVAQPTSFQTGASSTLLSDVTRTTSTVSLTPDSVPVGYVSETYNLYGIILQPGNTYVSII